MLAIAARALGPHVGRERDLARADEARTGSAASAIRALLVERWNIHHATLEPEREHCSGGDGETWKAAD